ncbi:hypothetical protein XarzCFBP7410_16300 [Xanthomonas arboricola pv. zantedeschiae]|nr:hypothetical protein XarzCFBP7410_16300 [Xanthomonas arboricola pv. zantedeschiae]PPU06898.1 hypothetical protein XarjCFBP1022_19650 [Xanthomonas arboricola]PPU26436.1 hypothetical protein XarCFBP6762_11670 [Xanthomonas arboricola]
MRRGRSKARAPVARKPCLLAPQGEGLCSTPWPASQGGATFPGYFLQTIDLRANTHASRPIIFSIAAAFDSDESSAFVRIANTLNAIFSSWWHQMRADPTVE